jgi:hypothetical protein
MTDHERCDKKETTTNGTNEDPFYSCNSCHSWLTSVHFEEVMSRREQSFMVLVCTATSSNLRAAARFSEPPTEFISVEAVTLH